MLCKSTRVCSIIGFMKQAKEKLNSDEDILRIKREGQARSRQLVRDGIRTKESMFLFPRDVVKAAKIKFRD